MSNKTNKWMAIVRQLRKKDIEWLASHYCEHSHPYLSHLSCFLRDRDSGKLTEKECPIAERIGFLDLECSNLHASFGYIFSYAIKELNGDIIGRVLTTEEIQSFKFDENLMRELCKDLREFQRIVVHWGTDAKFDLPFCRSRALKFGLDFPLHKEIYCEDTCTMSRNKLRLHNNRLETICDFFNIPAKGHRLNSEVWQKALAGHEPSLRYIWKHNVEDVVSLEQVWKKLHLYTLRGKRSI